MDNSSDAYALTSTNLDVTVHRIVRRPWGYRMVVGFTTTCAISAYHH